MEEVAHSVAMKKKSTPYLILFAVLLLAGVAVLLYPTVSNLIIRKRLNDEIDRYNRFTSGNGDLYYEQWAAAEEYNRYLASKENQFVLEDGEKERVEGLLDPLGNGMMGYIDIPKIGEHIPIYHGTEEKQLQSGAGYWYGSSLPTGGSGTHCIITAHSGLVKAKLFTDLDQLEVGDRFILRVLDRVLEYEVNNISVTEPSDMSGLYISDGEDYVTLYTCTPYGINTQRLLVRGVRVVQSSDDAGGSADVDRTDVKKQTTLKIIILIAVFLATVAAVIFMSVRYARQSRAKQR